MKRLLYSGLILTVATLATTARADSMIGTVSTFTYSYDGSATDATANTSIPVDFNLSLTGTVVYDDGYGFVEYGINEISSVDPSNPSAIDGQTVTFDDIVNNDPTEEGIAPSGYDDDSNLSYDNLYNTWNYDGETYEWLDGNGLGFTSDGDFFRIYTDDDDDPVEYGVPLTATPEPSSLLLLGTGLAGIVGAIRRKANAR